MKEIRGRNLSVPGYYWRQSGTEWHVVRFSMQEVGDPFGERVLDTVGWDIPEVEAAFADDVFVGPIPEPMGESGSSDSA